MSAGGLIADNDLSKLAPRFREAVFSALADCEADGLDAMVYEAYRSPELQALYYARGRTIIPPEKPVTYAKSNLQSWHGYGLAVDVISAEYHWNRPREWFAQVATCFCRHGCRWGGTWKQQDLPHFQLGILKPSPSDRARELYASGGMQAVWKTVGAS